MVKDLYIYVLYIEDERPVIDLVREALKLAGYKVVGATSGRQGLSLMRERKPDLIMLDLMMPDLNGWDVYREMKKDDILANIPVIVVSAKVPDRGKVIIEDLPPVDDYITKPFDVEQLIRAVKGILSNGKAAK
jgi:DNA-binding response OmpR family regulator